LFKRLLSLGNRSFFLLGPRGTGKTFWLRETFRDRPHLYINLLKSSEFISLQQDPQRFQALARAQPRKSWVIVDEVQKLPSLLDDVHDLLEDPEVDLTFCLTGSSARKLKSSGANLLAGRASNQSFFPLTSLEIGTGFVLMDALRFGGLPLVVNARDTAEKVEVLSSYVETYLREEIQQEALVRQLGVFSRFLRVSSLLNAEILSLSNIARDVGVSRSTAQGYFQVLVDTLLGFTLPAWQPQVRVKELSHPKFYWFDTGVALTLQGRVGVPLQDADAGKLFETFVINQLRAVNAYTKSRGEFYYWRTRSGVEVDCVIEFPGQTIGLEIKFSNRWRPSFAEGLQALLKEKRIDKAYVAYIGSAQERRGDILLLPWQDLFGEIFNV
jgi:predicted AAA+ superfamily ATPase